MADLLTPALMTAVIVACVAAALPLMLAALGETLGEQSGVLNLGLEGMLLLGGFAAFATVLATGSFALGMLVGGFVGALCGALFALLTVWLGLNQIVIGLAITLAGTGITSVLSTQLFGATNPRLGLAPVWRIPLLADLPGVGEGLFAQPPYFLVTLALAAGIAWMLAKTRPGLRLRAAGQQPGSLDAAGGNVVRTRSAAALIGGTFAGFGGAYLAVLSAGTFTPAMTNGLGYIAIVVTMLARGRIRWVVLGSLLYGATVASGTVLQLTTLNVPTDLIKMLPFVVMMLVLVLAARKSGTPPALGEPYVRGAR
ncbi:ABC transporter permease [Lysinibacter cavernae]|uniref:Simple sugar transport system permease protein n=1 Tax=Lysinibacter cavernae TaxID=1640652 RepID=A0A7X5R225_9MICO|nr:ABC transporter permease [Lysinibacter cavernae]NIH54238.1 simple sugar transport system permease protein [Lysinibacter cavernae]